ncbi:hypothetical protein GGQ72_000207 [Rhizobium rhizoryzae]|uniref:Uncharacterized protein n=1 Tax=Rhizobium rhizoryzae TaxID=451876 RepID=A0A7W6LCB4_9HYPH|nr:hypothetical protein [Rhizobium rhizoryzae]
MGSRPIQVLRHSRSKPFTRSSNVVDPASYFVEKPRRYFGIAYVFRLVSHPDRLTPFQQDDGVLTLVIASPGSFLLR